MSRPGFAASPLAPAAILAVFWIGMLASLHWKSLTMDEPIYPAGGYAAWKFDDFRLNPENGTLVERWMALPFLFGSTRFPPPDDAAWRNSQVVTIGERWFNRMGNDTGAMLRVGRAVSGLFAVALGALVWALSRRIFGPTGALVSLLLFALDPTILANGALMTSDAACALFFLASAAALWASLHRVSAGRVAAGGALLAGLFLTKMSAVLIVPVAGVLAAVRLVAGPPIEIELAGRWRADRPAARAAVAAAVLLAQAAIVLLLIWAAYGFRYGTFSPRLAAGSRLEESWGELLGPPGGSPVAAALAFLRAHRLLPEAYIYGLAHTWRFSLVRSAFLNGRVSLTGWWWFFPYSFLVKTPLGTLLACAGAAGLMERRFWYPLAPLAALFAVYWAFAILSPLNIGHRHLLPVYPPLFVFCGVLGHRLDLLRAGRGRRVLAAMMVAPLALLLAETASSFPNYLSYFNIFAGGSSGAYRHLVDSSLDWGQDLPGLGRYLLAHPGERPAFLSYFGIASPEAYHLPVENLHSVRGDDVKPPIRSASFPPAEARAALAALTGPGSDYDIIGGSRGADGRLQVLLLKKPDRLLLHPGYYFISATLLQPVMYDYQGPLGPWNARYERTYRLLSAAVAPLLASDSSARDAALAGRTPSQWAVTLNYFDTYRFARLTAYLRQRSPEGTINGSILIYRLGEADLARALGGPPPELGPDLPVQAGRIGPGP